MGFQKCQTIQVWAAVARRCGLECHPLADMPQHVLIRVPLRASDSAESAGYVRIWAVRIAGLRFAEIGMDATDSQR